MVVGQVDPTLCKEYKGSVLSELSTPGAFGFHMSLKTLEDIEEPIFLARSGQTTAHSLFSYSLQTENGFYILFFVFIEIDN